MNHIHPLRLRIPLIVLGVLAAILLSACAQVAIQPTPPPAYGVPSLTPSGAPTTVPTSVQPNWPGPEWQVAHQGDFNGDGLNEKIYILPSPIVPDEATFYRPGYEAYHWVATEALIIQEQDGVQRILATISPLEVRSEHMVLATLAGASRRPAAFFVAAPLDDTTPLATIPLDSAGMGYTQGFGLRWNPDTSAYRLLSGPEATLPQPALVSGFVGFPAGGVPPMTVNAVDFMDFKN